MNPDLRRLPAAARDRPYDAAAVLLAVTAGLLVLAIAHELFPYHSMNDDEGVYLQQAAMLLDGRLFLTPDTAAVRDAIHPWFFVGGERGLYPKYAPVPAAVFALGKLAGGYRLALGVVAAASIGLGYWLAASAFDRRTGLLAAGTMAAAPLFLVNAATFLPYATTTALNLLFAVAYVRSVRRRERRYAALAGLAVGLAFFARPYTAVLFAGPFVLHALWLTVRALPDGRETLERTAITAGVGLLFVAVALGYNVVVTGSALLFPFEAFAPRDGVGFGRRAILGHGVDYTLGLALAANARVLWTFASGWFTAGLLGSAAAAVGVGAVAMGLRRDGLDRTGPLGERRLQLLLAGVVVSVVVGNVAFWGNLNILGRFGDPTDGLVSGLGPFYHFDLLLPLSAFAAHGVLTTADRLGALANGLLAPAQLRLAAVVLLVVAVPLVGAAEVAVLEDPVARNAAHTAKLDRAYAPFETAGFDRALVFLPPTYGEWRNHPFQWLRNDPDLAGPAVYALSLGPAADFAVADASPDRQLYRYRYHGVWTPDVHRQVAPLLERLRRVEGRSVTARTRVAVPDRITHLSVAVSDGEAVRRFDYRGDLPKAVAVEWTIASDGVAVAHPNLTAAGSPDRPPLQFDEPTELVLTVTLTEPGGGTLTYREAVLVRPTDAGVELLWPPASSACPLVTDCGLEGTYLPDRPATRPTGIAMNTTLVEVTG